MRKLQYVKYEHTSKMDEKRKDSLLIPKKYNGVVAVECWEVNGLLEYKGVCVKSVRDYIMGFGDFKDVPIHRDYYIYVCKKCGCQMEESRMGKKCPDCGTWTYYKDCEKQVRLMKEGGKD